jgi:hypothetical protein
MGCHEWGERLTLREKNRKPKMEIKGTAAEKIKTIVKTEMLNAKWYPRSKNQSSLTSSRW